MRYAIIVKPGPSPCPIIRIDTNQGVYGLGEVRDVGGYQYAMVLKNRIVGENPLKIDYLFQKIQQFGGISRQAGGVCAVEMALWDIAGKVYNCPVYQMTPWPAVAPRREMRKSLKLPQRRKASVSGFVEVMPVVFNWEKMGDSFIFKRI